jgi:uncharacterized protein YhbP (UPF0306 family)
MAALKELLQQYLPTVNIMQLATCVDNQPWVCTVHYYSDDSLNLYWISREDRRHSQDIKQNQKVAAAVLVHENTPTENYIIGISIEGIAECIGKDVDEQVGKSYVDKLNKAPNLLPDIKSGKNPHKFYCLKPTKIILFDTIKFPTDPRQEYTLP